jgi:uncharacterized membrane protein YphA (DoxX/SURF4 family)
MVKNSGTNGTAGPKLDSGGKNWLAILRIFIGAYFIHTSLDKFTASHLGEFSRQVSRWAHDTPYEWYKGFLNQYIAPHSKFFAYLTACGEFYIGVTLLIGFISGLAVILGVLLHANYFLGSSFSDQLWNHGLMIVCLLVILFTSAGRIFGLDKYLSKKILIKYLV